MPSPLFEKQRADTFFLMCNMLCNSACSKYGAFLHVRKTLNKGEGGVAGRAGRSPDAVNNYMMCGVAPLPQQQWPV